MKIKKIKLTEKDKRKAYRSAVRQAAREAGIDKLTVTKIFENKKKYKRKNRNQVLRDEDRLQ